MTTLGEGGMITTDDAALVRHLHNLRQFGGEVEWGTNFKMTKVQAAVGLVQLSRLDEMNRRRREAAQKRSQLLEGAPGLVLPHEPAGYTHIYYVYAILVQPQWAGEKRDRILSIMEDKFGIACAVSNPPTYQRWPYIAKMCGTPILKVSEDIGKRLLCAPLHPLFTEEQELYICASLIESIDMVNNNP